MATVSSVREPRVLTVGCLNGLANRLRVLLSAHAIGELTDRVVTVLWPRSRACGATFTELFENDLGVVEVPEAEVVALPSRGGFASGRLPDLGAAVSPDPFQSGVWLFPMHDRRARQSDAGTLPPEVVVAARARVVELLEQLVPVAPVRRRVAAFHDASFSPEMIGVHLRRGDLTRFRPEVVRNLDVVVRRVESYLEERPGAGILLCTDDGAPDAYRGTEIPSEGIRAVFGSRFPGRVVSTTPRSLVRSERESVEDALVDLLLLRRVSMFVGTEGSSFSELATIGRDVPAIALGRGRRRDRVLRYTGAEAAIIGVGYVTLGRTMPANTVLRQLRRSAGSRLPRNGAQ